MNLLRGKMPVDKVLKPIIKKKLYKMVWLFNKPLGLSSFSLVDIVKQLEGIQKAGHSGTLDPLATGDLIVAAGPFTKMLPRWLSADKRYTVKILFGASTQSGDLETPFENIGSLEHSTDFEARLVQALGFLKKKKSILIGEHSALKSKGKAFYKQRGKGKSRLKPNIIKEFRVVGAKALNSAGLKQLLENYQKELTGVYVWYKNLPIKPRPQQLELFQKLVGKLHVNQELIRDGLSLITATVEFTVGKGTYIRYIVKELSAIMDTPATCLSIHREYLFDTKE